MLLTGGGGGDFERVVSTYLDLLERFRPPVESQLVLGPDFPVAGLGRLALQGEERVTVARFLPDLFRAMVHADLVVSMAGYNTVCELRSAGRPAILVPRVWPRQEQLLRATAMERQGRARLLTPERLTAESLWRTIEEMIVAVPPAPELLSGGRVAAAQARRLVGAA